MRRILSPVLALALALTACGGGDARLETAEVAFRRGNLDGAAAALEGLDSSAATELRARIEERRAAREALERRIAEAEALEPDESLEALARLLREETDPVAREAVEVAQSRAYDRRALAVASRPRPEAPRGEHAPATAAPPARPASAEAALVAATRAEVRVCMETREWARGLAAIELALDGAGAAGRELEPLRAELRELAAADLDALLSEVDALETGHGLELAHAHLAREARRFPSTGRFEELARELRDLEGRLELLALAEREPAPRPASTGTAPARPVETPRAVGSALQQAAQLEEAGELRAAAELWIDHAVSLPPSDGRDAAVGRSRELERRALLREELAAACARDAAGFAELGVTGEDTGRLVVDGRRVEWEALRPELLTRVARRAQLSEEARLGLVFERLARGDVDGPDGALAELHRLAESGRLGDAEVWRLVARARGEEPPEEGYVFRDGAWISRGDHEAAERLALAGKLEERLRKARPEERDALVEELFALGAEAEPALARAVQARWLDARSKLRRGATLKQLEGLAEQRRELDRRREHALELIFDEVRYFYPYNPPAVDPDKAKDYWPVQQEVDRRVAAVRETWEASRAVQPPAAFRAALTELAWARERALELALELESEEPLPEWIDGLDPELAELSLAGFAWDAGERERLAYDRAVRARNERLFEVSDRPKEERADASEAEQVRITNDYRQLFGRRALAWNPRIQAAARMHSEYMANTGDFGHFEPDPERRTPGDRMRLAGYLSGISENCHRGGAGPRGAHDGWTHSSGHHRNLLNPGHREMASAVASSYWTQNFGVGTDFLAELEHEPDAR